MLRPFLVELEDEYATKLSDVRTRLAAALRLRLERAWTTFSGAWTKALM
ncbi:MAG: hypothetical protein IPI49_14905 [Myxococcales bacterium]|nr:hypothetical protein [Myxococcales bacterium]